MTVITFTVPGLPIGKGRARASAASGFVRFHTPAKTVSYEAQLKHFALDAMTGQPIMLGPLHVTVRAVFPKAASWSKKKAAAAIWHTSKPDADNLLKCLDGLNKVVWADDSQVAKATIEKIYSDDGTASMTVTIQSLGE